MVVKCGGAKDVPRPRAVVRPGVAGEEGACREMFMTTFRETTISMQSSLRRAGDEGPWRRR